MKDSDKPSQPKKSNRRYGRLSTPESPDIGPLVEALLEGYSRHSVTLRAGVMELNWRLATTEAMRAAFFVQRLRSLGLPNVSAQYSVLRDLYFSEDKSLSQTEIMRGRGVSSGTMTRLIHRMERTGLVQRSIHPLDKRSILVRLTETGNALCEKVVPVIAQEQSRISTCFTDEELDTLNSLLTRFHVHVEELAGTSKARRHGSHGTPHDADKAGT